MKFGILTKQLLILALVSLMAITAVVVISVRTGFDVMSESAKDELLREAHLFSSSMGDSMTAAQLDSLAKILGKRTNIRFTVIDESGKVLADTEEDPVVMENHADRPEVIEALGSKDGSSVRFSTTTKQYRVYCATIRRNDSGQIVIRASMTLDSISKLNENLSRGIIPWAALLLVIAVAFVFISQRLINKRIEGISGVASKIAKGDFSTRIRRQNDEFGSLEYSINLMAIDLQAMFDEIDRQKKDLLEILRSLHEGVLVLDSDNRIVLINPSLENIAGIDFDTVKGMDILAVLLIKELRDMLNDEGKARVEFSREGKRYHAELFTIPALSQKLVVIRDITEHFRIQQTKTDFVSNVSHELRTPLSLIKGYAETLNDEPLLDDQRKYIETIMRHTDRMIALIEDLLTLSKIETGAKAQFENIELAPIVRMVLPLFERKAREKGISIEFDATEEPLSVFADRSLLEIAFSNLIDNAIKYNREDGAVSIRLEQAGNRVMISFTDTGIGIPPSETSRVFERFYTVDKSRSRALCSTGLGLSIVKHVVLLHGGELSLNSVEGEGSTFTIAFTSL